MTEKMKSQVTPALEKGARATTIIDLLRHGEPEGGEMFRGHTDVPLTEQGWQQMRRAVENGDQAPWQRVISSPLQRCNNFARHLAEQHDIPHSEESAMREISFGDWDGASFEHVRREYKEQLKQYWADVSKYTPPNGEPMSAFRTRLVGFWNSLIERHEGEHLLLVSHGGVIRVLLAEVLDMPLKSIIRLSVPYACLSRVSIHHTQGHQPWVQLEFHQGSMD